MSLLFDVLALFACIHSWVYLRDSKRTFKHDVGLRPSCTLFVSAVQQHVYYFCVSKCTLMWVRLSSTVSSVCCETCLSFTDLILLFVSISPEDSMCTFFSCNIFKMLKKNKTISRPDFKNNLGKNYALALSTSLCSTYRQHVAQQRWLNSRLSTMA